MAAFNSGSSLSSVASAVTNATKVVSNAASSSTGIVSAIRSKNLPAAGEIIGDVVSAVALFKGDEHEDDWRVRLSLPLWSSFTQSPVLAPLKNAGGLIFPYTPSVQISSHGKYNYIDTTHSNYNHYAFKNHDTGTISINAPMHVEDQTQALYWIAAVHFLRSLTKMFTGYDAKSGNPPPIVFLNGYGNYVLKNVPVVVTGFQTTLDAQCDYIGCDVVGTLAGEIGTTAGSLAGLSNTIGSIFSDISGVTNTVSSALGTVGEIANLAGTFGLGGTISGGTSYVPVRSTFSVTLQPVYSKESARKFSLDTFVTGGYLSNGFGYI